MTQYILRDGTHVTKDQIKTAYNAGDAVIIHGHGDGKSTSCLMLDGEHWDLRDECYEMSAETWTREPKTIFAALLAARV